MIKHGLVPFALLALSQGIFAQQAPTAGNQLQQIPPSPVLQNAPPAIRLEQGSPPPSTPDAKEVKVLIKSLQVTGAQVYSEAELIGVTGFKPGSELSLTDLRAMALRITEHYQKAGYFVAQAYLPAQDIKDNAVTIAVLEGRYGNITLRNQSNLSDAQANSLLRGLNSGDIITTEPLESRLLLLSDLPGVTISSTLVPGASPGTSDLIVDVAPGKRVSGSIDFDNAGGRYTGEYRLGATVNLNNPLGQGDVASLRVLTTGSGLNYARASYQMQFGKARGGIAYSKLYYKLGEEFAPLGANGTAEVASIFGTYSLIRSRNNNVSAGLAYENKKFQDKVDLTASVTDKKAQVLTASLYGDLRDGLGGGGITSYSLNWSAGIIDIQTPSALAGDAATARSNGSFNKIGYRASRLQSLGGPFSLYAGINGQFASKNLDVSEKMELGGLNAVRAYPQGEAYADEGYVATLEARMLLPKVWDRIPGQMQLIGFVDGGSVTTNKNPWFTGPNTRSLSGAGVGITWADNNNFFVRAYYARRLGSEKAISAPDRTGRFWIQAVKYF